MRRFVWLLLLIVFVAFIFYNSSMPVAESHRASELVGSILTGMGKWFGIDVPQQNLDYNIRKLAHFLEFAILGVILCNVYAGVRCQSSYSDRVYFVFRFGSSR